MTYGLASCMSQYLLRYVSHTMVSGADSSNQFDKNCAHRYTIDGYLGQ